MCVFNMRKNKEKEYVEYTLKCLHRAPSNAHRLFNKIPAIWSQSWLHPFGVLFFQNSLLAPPLESERKPFQKHEHSPLLE